MSFGAFLGAAAWLAASRRRTSRAQTALAAREVWARIEAVGDGVWAVVSTPSPDDRTSYATFCNGGIIAGRERVLVFEGFGSADGGAWVAEQARNLAGRPATDVVISHHHGDQKRGARSEPCRAPSRSHSAPGIASSGGDGAMADAPPERPSRGTRPLARRARYQSTWAE